jgi:hypothetical protein
MASFTNNPLRHLDSIYRFVGGMTGLRRFDLEAGITPVHDVSRNAALDGVGLNAGFWLARAQQVHSGAGEISDSIPIYSGTAGNGYPNPMPLDVQAWVLGGFGILGGTDSLFSEASIVVEHQDSEIGPSDLSTAGGEPQLIWHADTASTLQLNETQIFFDGGPSNVINHPIPIIRGPTDGGGLRFQSAQAGAGAVTVTLFARMWLGRLGTTPPGMM